MGFGINFRNYICPGTFLLSSYFLWLLLLPSPSPPLWVYKGLGVLTERWPVTAEERTTEGEREVRTTDEGGKGQKKRKEQLQYIWAVAGGGGTGGAGGPEKV
jgi:hypothetical protein